MIKTIALVISAILSFGLLFSKNPLFIVLAYPFFVLVYLFQKPLSFAIKIIPLPVWLKFFLVTEFIALGVFEFLSWFTNYSANDPNAVKHLFHPQLFPDLFIGIGFYASWPLAWWFLLRRYRFSLREVFFTHGIYGMFIEQRGQVLINSLQLLPDGFIFLLLLVLVYGGTMGASYVLISLTQGKKSPWYKYAVALAVLFLATFLTSEIWDIVFRVFEFNFPIYPIRQQPLI